MRKIRHEMILASAGSGKTHALTNRFVELLAHGAKPERIVALTFTRKAAGEFFDKILEKLARAAMDGTAAGSLAHEIGRPELGCADFLALLRNVVDAMPRLRLGTLDGFFAGIVRTFPLELGLAGDFEVMEEHAARAERRSVLRRMFSVAGKLAPAQREFAEAFKLATFGREEKRLGARLEGFIDAHHQVWLEAPDVGRWGDAARIWPDGCRWIEPGDAVAAARELRAWLDVAGITDRPRARWLDFIAAVAAWQPGAALATELKYVLEKALDAWSEVGAGRAVALEFFKKKQDLTPAASEALAVLVRRVVGGELARHLAMTRGVAEVLRSYEAVYHDAVRRAGKLGFDDVRRLLEPGADVPTLTQFAPGAGRLAIDYRLDAEIDHWLIDEFQDTSFAQWSVLRGLIDEAVQDPEQRRSFFYVGDVKQAIFGWRGGDVALFREIFSHYNRIAPATIVERQLVASWRSGPAVIEMVNAVFGDAAAVAGVLPGGAGERWNGEWRAHRSAVPRHTGQAALLHADDEPSRRQLTLDLLREIEPLRRGLSCAVLVRDNASAAEIADFLRANDVPAMAEADLRVAADNPAGAALLALVQAAAHPGDTLAWNHLWMSPLGAVLAAEEIATPEALTRRVLAQIHTDGFERMMRTWAQRIEGRLAADDAFTRGRLRQFVAAAADFDATGSRDATEFAAFMHEFTLREPEGAAVVRVMTIHKAKGLGFDVVVLPELEGQKLEQRRAGLAVQRTADRAVDWVLELPNRTICDHDPVLAAHLRAAEAENGYEQLSLLYVAMTRAKRAMFVLSAPPGNSTSQNFPRLLGETLGAQAGDIRVGGRTFTGTWSSGDPDWHRGVLRSVAAPRAPDVIEPVVGAARAPRRLARRPSVGAGAPTEAVQLFRLDRGGAVEFGRTVHTLLESVEWGGAAEADRLAAEWLAHGLAGETALACLRAPTLAGVWRRPGNGGEVWRERSFELVLDGAWVAGVFDRVVVERDAAGGAVRVMVYDFKTDHAPGEPERRLLASRYAAQLALYRRAAALLTGVQPAAVGTALVFTGSRQVVPVTPA